MALQVDGLLVCAGEPVDVAGTVEIALRERPDVCLIDEGLIGGALAAADAVHRGLPAAKLLLLIGSEEPKALLAGVRAGIIGYVRTDLDPARLASTVRGVASGEAAFSRRLTLSLVEKLRARERGRSAPTTPGGPSMTDRELEVLEVMAEGLRTSEIAHRLGIAEVTVRRHVSSAVSKLGVADRAAAIAVLTGRSRA